MLRSKSVKEKQEIKREVERAKREALELQKRCRAFAIAEIKDRKEAATSNQSSSELIVH